MNPGGETTRMSTPKKPVSREAAVALALASAALLLATLGVFIPSGGLRYPVTPKLTGTNAVLVYGATFVLPIILGLAGAWLGGRAYRTIERLQGNLGGDGLAFFALMIGFFAAAVGAATTFAALVWPNL